MIVAERLGKFYELGNRRVEVLNDLDLRVPAGDFVAITGSSGAGKSTLLQIFGCLDIPSSGEYRLAGNPVSRLSERELAEVRNRRIGFIFQTSHFVDYLDLVDNVALHGFYARNYNESDSRRRALELLTEVGLAHRVSHKPAELSGGERQRAAVARALFNSPDLILADEPTGNLDGKNSAVFAGLVRRLNQQGITIVMATHDESMAAFAKRQLHLKDGKLKAEV